MALALLGFAMKVKKGKLGQAQYLEGHNCSKNDGC